MCCEGFSLRVKVRERKRNTIINLFRDYKHDTIMLQILSIMLLRSAQKITYCAVEKCPNDATDFGQ